MDKFPAVIVVEGKTDKDLILSFLDADIITTNGSEISRETINYIKEIKKKRDVVVLTDPDYPGNRIRNILDQNIDGLKHAYIPKEKAIKHHKVGVAESSKKVILEALNNIVPSSSFTNTSSTLTYNDLYELKLISCDDADKNRKKISDKFHIGHTNSKSLLKRVNALNLTKTDLLEALNGR